MSAYNENEFCTLVQSLMSQGWYRIPKKLMSSGSQWGFRQGHTLENPMQECWVVANSEIEAMRIMWNLVSAQQLTHRLARELASGKDGDQDRFSTVDAAGQHSRARSVQSA